MVDQVAAATEFVGYPPIAIAGQFVLDVLNEGDEFYVREFGRFSRRTVIEGASRQVDHLTPPSN